MTKLEMLSKWDTKLLKNVFQNVNGGAAFPPFTKSVTKSEEIVTLLVTPLPEALKF